jgi:DegV family protein with EDD domain
MIDAEYYIIITISGKLSGSYNSAMIAKQTSSNPDNVLVVDSKLVAGAMELDVLKAQELIEKGLDFKTVSEELLKFRDSSNLLFMIDRYDNLIRAGRVNKVMAFIASHLHIKPLCYGENGEVKVKEKIRTVEGTLKRLVVNIGKMCADTVNRICVISHTNNQKAVNYLTDAISKEYHFKKIVVRENRGLCSYYSLEGAVMVGF